MACLEGTRWKQRVWHNASSLFLDCLHCKDVSNAAACLKNLKIPEKLRRRFADAAVSQLSDSDSQPILLRVCSHASATSIMHQWLIMICLDVIQRIVNVSTHLMGYFVDLLYFGDSNSWPANSLMWTCCITVLDPDVCQQQFVRSSRQQRFWANELDSCHNSRFKLFSISAVRCSSRTNVSTRESWLPIYSLNVCSSTYAGIQRHLSSLYRS